MTDQGTVAKRSLGMSDIAYGFLIAAIGAFVFALGALGGVEAFLRVGGAVISVGAGIAMLGGYLHFRRR